MLIGKSKVPLGAVISGRWVNYLPMREVMSKIKKATDPHVHRKPQRQLGGPWISDLIAGRRIFALCEECSRKYHPSVWEAQGYVPQYRHRELTDCDGCSEWRICSTFVPGETRGGSVGVKINTEEKKQCFRIAL